LLLFQNKFIGAYWVIWFMTFSDFHTLLTSNWAN